MRATDVEHSTITECSDSSSFSLSKQPGNVFEIALVLSFYWFSSSAWLMLSILIIALHLCFYWFLELAPWLCFASVYALYINMIFTFTRDVRQPLPQIRLSLCVSLGAGQIIFLSGINATEKMVSGYILLVEFLQRSHSWTKLETKKKWIFWSFLSFLLQTACITSAVLMQYFLMAAFCWMLVEGIYLYLLVVKVYNISDKMYIYHVMSWGMLVVQLYLLCCCELFC